MKLTGNQMIGLLMGGLVAVAIAAYLFFTSVPPTGPVVVDNRNPVTATVVYDQTCVKCPSTRPVVNSLKNNGVSIVNWTEIHYNSTEGRQFIENYNVERVPAIILSQNVMTYTFVRDLLSSVNITNSNGSYILYINPPFRDIAEDKIHGLVDVYALVDSTCAECYNVSLHGDVLADNFNMAINDVLYFDINLVDGDRFVTLYNITAVPAYIMTQEAKYYPALNRVWPSLGSIEPNGYYIFRNFSVIRLPYRNLVTGKIIDPENANATG